MYLKYISDNLGNIISDGIVREGCFMKIMKYKKALLLLMMILPWFTIPLLGESSFKRYIPAGLFITLMVRIANIIAKKRKWWWWYEPLHPNLSGVVPFMWGPFLVGSM
jgi:hypothetical protein